MYSFIEKRRVLIIHGWKDNEAVAKVIKVNKGERESKRTTDNPRKNQEKTRAKTKGKLKETKRKKKEKLKENKRNKSLKKGKIEGNQKEN